MQPRLTVSSASQLPIRLSSLSRAAAAVGADGLDVDATNWVGRLRSRDLARREDLVLPIRSVWISWEQIRDWAMDELRALRMPPGNLGTLLIVRLTEADTNQVDRATAIAASKTLDVLPSVAGVVLAVPAVASDGGRAHLARLRGVKRLAEEWEFTIALDLFSRTDVRWEAEAAIRIVGPRLSHVRVNASLRDGPGRRSDVLKRALKALADEGFAGTISLAPTTPFLKCWSLSIVERDLGANQNVVRRIFQERFSPVSRSNSASLRLP